VTGLLTVEPEGGVDHDGHGGCWGWLGSAVDVWHESGVEGSVRNTWDGELGLGDSVVLLLELEEYYISNGGSNGVRGVDFACTSSYNNSVCGSGSSSSSGSGSRIDGSSSSIASRVEPDEDDFSRRTLCDGGDLAVVVAVAVTIVAVAVAIAVVAIVLVVRILIELSTSYDEIVSLRKQSSSS